MTTLLDSEIKYSRETKDYDIFIAGEYVGSASTYSQAEQIRTAELLAHYEITHTPEKAAQAVMAEVR